MEPLLKRNKTNKQYSARLTRRLDRLNHFDISLKYTAGKEIKITDFVSRNPTETAEPEENYKEEFVINAIAQLATVNGRIGRIYEQSENSNTANMHDTRTRTGTRYSKTNTNHSNVTANQINNTIHDNRETHIELTKDNNNNNRRIPDRFALNDKLKYHWGADDVIMKIIYRRDNSPETQELVERRIELTRPGHMRHHWHKKLEREILLPRRPDDVDRKKIKRTDIRLRRKEENRVTHIGGSYFKNFGDEIPQASGTSSEINTETINTQKPAPDTESTVSSSPEEPVITEEPGSYPAIPVQDYRERPIEEIAVQYVRINKVIETKAPRNRQQEDNIRAAELDFMLDLETLINETAADPDLIEGQKCCIEDKNTQAIPDDYKQVAKKLTHRWGITMVDDRIIFPKSLRYAALNALHFGHPGINKMCNDAVIFWWPNMRADIEKKAKTCSACLNAGKKLKTQLPSTEKSKLESPKHPREEIQIDFKGNLNSKHLDSSPFILVAVDKSSRWPVAKVCKNTNHDTEITFSREYINVYGVLKTIKSDNGSAFISKEYKSFCKEYNIIREYGTPNLHTGTGLVERTIQSLKNLTKANLEETQNLRESLNKALYVLCFTTHSEIQQTPFELHFGREPGTKLSNLKIALSVNSKDLSVYITRISAGEITDHLEKTNDPKYRRGMTFTQKQKPSNTVSKKNTIPVYFFRKNTYKMLTWKQIQKQTINWGLGDQKHGNHGQEQNPT